MPRLHVRFFAVAALGFAAVSCDRMPGEPRSDVASVALTPVFASNGVAFQSSGAPIASIRLTARQVSSATVLETETITVDPTDEEWNLNFRITVPPGDAIQIRVTVELLNSSGGVEWSGTTEPFDLRGGPIGSPVEVPIFRGPLANLDITGVEITTASPTVEEGRTLTLAAQANGGGSGTQIYWTSLDPTIATVSSSGVVSGVVPGAARIVATAGAHSDQVSVDVTVRVATVEVTPANVTLASIGATQQYTARALDPRGVEVQGVTFTFAVSPANVATHEGSGLMRAAGNGTATVSATGRGTTGNTTLTVNQVAASVTIAPPVPVIQTIGGTVTLTGTVRDANNNIIAGAAVTWESLSQSIATVNPNTGVVTAVSSGVAQIRARASATVTATIGVTVGSQVLFTDGLETGTGWTFSTLAQRTSGSGITNTAFPTYVSTSGATLPSPTQGSSYLWFGFPQQGNYMGPQFTGDSPHSGGTSQNPSGTSGSATSPTFVVPAGVSTIFVSFSTWFEIESFAPNGFDLMRVELVDNGSGSVIATGVLNTALTPLGIADVPVVSGGGAAPAFLTVPLSATDVAGRTLRLRFLFDTGDDQYNGFRGWIVDDIRVGTTPPAGPPAMSGPASLRTMQACEVGGCPRPTAVRKSR